jgi:hypothetical protein
MEFTVKNLGICNNVAIGNGHDVVKTRGFKSTEIGGIKIGENNGESMSWKHQPRALTKIGQKS